MKVKLLTRRHFLKNSAAFGVSGLLIGCSNINTEVELLHSNTPPIDEMHNWLFIGTDNRIIVTVPCAEMGQGVNTSLAQLVADELDADWHTLEIRQAPLNSKFNNAMGMQLTGGSTAVRDYYVTMRKVGAGARSIIIKAAAAQLGTSVANLSTQDSHVIYQGKAFPYGQFASDAATWPVPDDVPLKSDDQLIIASLAKQSTVLMYKCPTCLMLQLCKLRFLAQKLKLITKQQPCKLPVLKESFPLRGL